MKLNTEFYIQNAIVLAPEILGKLLCRNLNGKIIKLRITETECYFGEEDTACHANKGKTERTKIMYENGGLAYIYLCYGIRLPAKWKSRCLVNSFSSPHRQKCSK